MLDCVYELLYVHDLWGMVYVSVCVGGGVASVFVCKRGRTEGATVGTVPQFYSLQPLVVINSFIPFWNLNKTSQVAVLVQ